MKTRWISAVALSTSLVLLALPAGAQNVANTRPGSGRTQAGALANQAAANANNAAGNPYVNPQVHSGMQSSQTAANANANAAETRNTNVGTTP